MYEYKRDNKGRKVRDEYGGRGYYVEDFRGDKIKTDQFGNQIYPSHWDNGNTSGEYETYNSSKGMSKETADALASLPLVQGVILLIIMYVVFRILINPIVTITSWLVYNMYKYNILFVVMGVIPTIKLITSKENSLEIRENKMGVNTRVIKADEEEVKLAKNVIYTMATIALINILQVDKLELMTKIFTESYYSSIWVMLRGYIIGIYFIVSFKCKRPAKISEIKRYVGKESMGKGFKTYNNSEDKFTIQ